ncbi:hypothetical protein Bhyg_05905, partial [Pseudolycoriella hygida]
KHTSAVPTSASPVHICKTVVARQPYQKNRRGPTQCSRYQRPGHGSRHCHMAPRCEFCAEGHLSTNCPNLAKYKKQAAEVAVSTSNESTLLSVKMPAKCCNCEQTDHFATDPKCPMKPQYAVKRTQIHSRLNYLCNAAASSKSASASSNLAAPLQMRHLQQTIHGATSSSSGDATNNKIPNPAKMPAKQ